MDTSKFVDWLLATLAVLLGLLSGWLLWDLIDATLWPPTPEGGVYVYLDDGTKLGGTFEGTEDGFWLVSERIGNRRRVTYHIDPDKVMAWREE